MQDKIKQIGTVKLVQLQPNGLITNTPGKTPTGYLYDPTRLVQNNQLTITPSGIESTLTTGERVLDIHHIDHPEKKYEDDDLVCIGFTSHYDAMRTRFGSHITDGIAGENIIIEYEEEIWPNDLLQRLGVENQDTGEMGIFEMMSYANPCAEFTQFCLQNQYKKIDKNKMKNDLQFLGNGRRGFLFILTDIHDVITVKPGDQVFVLSN